MSYQDDKRELLKLKQGIIEESDTIKEEKIEYAKPVGFKAKFLNFLYHYKLVIIAVAFVAGVFAFMMYDTLTKERMDLRILVVATTDEANSILYFKSNDIETGVEKYCPDYDENGYVHVETYYIDMTEGGDPNYYFANQAKLYGEISTGTAHIFMGNKDMFQGIIGDADTNEMFVNLEELYPDNENVDGIYYKIKGTEFAGACKWIESCPDDLYICVRNVFDGMTSNQDKLLEYHEKSLEVLDNIIKDNKLNTGKAVS